MSESTAAQMFTLSAGGSAHVDNSIPSNLDSFHLPAHYYAHIVDRKTGVMRLEVGPHTVKVRPDRDRVTLGPKPHVVVPPGCFCVIENPVERNIGSTSFFNVVLDDTGNPRVRNGAREIRTHSVEPFPLFPGEHLVGKPIPLPCQVHAKSLESEMGILFAASTSTNPSCSTCSSCTSMGSSGGSDVGAATVPTPLSVIGAADPADESQKMREFVRGLPKAELHVHIEGTLEPELMFSLAQRNGIVLPFKSAAEVRAAYAFGNLQDFLDIYYQGAAVLQTVEDFSDLALDYFRRFAADGGTHAEVFFDPQTHVSRGISMGTVMSGLLAGAAEAERQFGISAKLIMCFLRHLDEQDASAILDAALPWVPQLAAVGLDSSEVGHPPLKFARVFAAAKALGLRVVAHAGEEGPPAYVWEAIDEIRVDRVDHGNRALEDPELVARLVRDQIPLTVCPLSNLKLCVVKDMKQHPIRRMLELGLLATVNSDDPAYFGGYVLDNYMAVPMNRAEIVQLARNSFTASFLTNEEKAAAHQRIDEYVSRFV